MLNSCISDVRKQFDDIDKSILILLGIRTKLSKEIAMLKKQNNMNAIQLSVWKNQIENRLKENEKIKVDPDFMNKNFDLIHVESVRIQNQVLEK